MVPQNPDYENIRELTVAEFLAFRNFIYEISGLYFSESKKYLLDSRIRKRMIAKDLNCPLDYLHMIRDTGRENGELLSFLDAVTTHETSFFRNEQQIDGFRKILLPKLIDHARQIGRRHISIWSAGCSSGEEPYTLAMVVREALEGSQEDWKVRIVGTDISEAVLTKAQKGLYRQYSLRNIRPYYLRRYFDNRGDGVFEISKDIRDMVLFGRINLASEEDMARMKRFDVIFCRNVLIYFDKLIKTRVISMLERSLDDKGYLLIGHSESLYGLSERFKLIHMTGALAYKKRTDEAANILPTSDLC